MQAIKVNIIHNCYDNTSRLIIRFLLKSSLFGTLKQHRTDLNYKNYKIYNLKSSQVKIFLVAFEIVVEQKNNNEFILIGAFADLILEHCDIVVA